ncbi:hypothetical protein D1871_16305 [Nakamurella silvestris]|nr:hypothetical protein D1871_16305 [Nakamurella silvestris]
MVNSRHSFAQLWQPVSGAVGVVLAVTGTFLPWIQSGRVAKNSYQLAGAAERYLPDVNSVVTAAVALWPWQGPAWAVVLVLYLLRLRRTAAIAGGVLALLLLTVSVAALVLGPRADSSWVTMRSAGPVVTTIGCALVLVAAVLITLRRRNVRIGVFTPASHHS